MLLSQAQTQGADVRRPLTVSEAMTQAKRSLESVSVRLIGEVSEVNAKAGYKAVYFTVKDAGASLPCMMWNNRYRACGVNLAVGMLVELTGRFTLYAPKGRMNFDVTSISLTGEGELRRRVAELARKLQAEGLTDPRRKRPLPVMPQHIGVVTSPRGAAVHDVLRTLRRRWPLAKVSLAGVAVEGVGAPAGLIEGLRACVRAHCEVILLVRGGGSFEDLMPFNDESLARAIAACPVPIVTGIGHEPDNSIADMVADVRASTPTGAAETVSPDASRLRLELDARGISAAQALERMLERERLRLDRLATRPLFADPMSLFATDSLTLDVMRDRLGRCMSGSMERDAVRLGELSKRLRGRAPSLLAGCAHALDSAEKRVRLQGSSLLDRHNRELASRAGRLHDLSPLAVIARGYAFARDEEGSVVKSVSGVAVGQRIDVHVSDGVLGCTVDNVRSVDSTDSNQQS